MTITMGSLSARRVSAFMHDFDRVMRGNEGDFEFEVIVACPSALGDHAGLLWAREEGRLGTGGAHSLAFSRSQGEYVVAMNDDTRIVVPEAFLGSIAEIRHREKTCFPTALGLRGVSRPVAGTAYGLYYPSFPAMSRESIDAAGGWYDPAFKTGWADVDLGMRVWLAGGECSLATQASIVMITEEAVGQDSRFSAGDPQLDFQTFCERYHGRLGRHFRKRFRSINRNYPISFFINGSFSTQQPPWRVFVSFLFRELRVSLRDYEVPRWCLDRVRTWKK